MVANAQGAPTDSYNALLSEINKLKSEVAALSRRTLAASSIGAGGLTISGGGSLTIGPGGNINMPAGGHIKDAVGNILFSADGLTGQRLSTPYLAVPMVPRWQGGRFRTNTGAGDYSIPASSITAESTLWEGEAPQILHPQAIWSGVIGRIVGTTSTPTYKFYVNNVLIGTVSTTTYGFYQMPPTDITAAGVFGIQIVPIKITVQADISSTDDISFTVYNTTLAGR